MISSTIKRLNDRRNSAEEVGEDAGFTLIELMVVLLIPVSYTHLDVYKRQLHTQDAPQTIDRVIDVFPTNQQEQIRVMLASTLEGVVTQQLIVNADGTGRIPCSEVLVCTSAIRNLIRQSKSHQIYSLMQVGASFGMQTMDQGLRCV